MDKKKDFNKEYLKLKIHKQRNNESENSNSNSIVPFSKHDITEVALLSQIYFPASNEISLNTLKKSIEQLYFTDGELNSNCASLVNRGEDGTVNGFLGVITNSFRYKERMIKVANCHHLVTTEQARTKLVPMRMLQKFLSGPQDLSFADNSSESTHLLWKRLGGKPAICECIFYKIPLRPVSFMVRPFLKKLNKPVKKMTAMFASGTDTVAGKFRLPMFYRRKSAVKLTPLQPQMLLEALDIISNRYLLFPQYDQSKIEHLFNLLSREKRYGTLHKLAILDENREIAGWFIYYSKKGGVCEVIQAVSLPGKEKFLFDSLTWHAYMQGGIELSGRLMANQLHSPFALKAFCMPARMWTLFHTTDTELMLNIQTGKAFLTRLEGDLWLI